MESSSDNLDTKLVTSLERGTEEHLRDEITQFLQDRENEIKTICEEHFEDFLVSCQDILNIKIAVSGLRDGRKEEEENRRTGDETRRDGKKVMRESRTRRRNREMDYGVRGIVAERHEYQLLYAHLPSSHPHHFPSPTSTFSPKWPAVLINTQIPRRSLTPSFGRKPDHPPSSPQLFPNAPLPINLPTAESVALIRSNILHRNCPHAKISLRITTQTSTFRLFDTIQSPSVDVGMVKEGPFRIRHIDLLSAAPIYHTHLVTRFPHDPLQPNFNSPPSTHPVYLFENDENQREERRLSEK
ncbi:hypothetical protein BLNAU_183 [Blattamonas nauphoetae]|uniref:Uncharacterized protein n=1 Tax=Blattamonas nauphoetae TaxID=2049346 RepID=A0ABQ9YM99_9EUKA|nr:hypothetical protein BLNAU_183 [Blattamonas nauphoetae]